MKPTFVVIAVLTPFGSALPQAFGIPLFMRPGKSQGHVSDPIQLAEMGLNHAGTSRGSSSAVAPSGVVPSGVVPSGIVPSGVVSSGATPSSTAPSDTASELWDKVCAVFRPLVPSGRPLSEEELQKQKDQWRKERLEACDKRQAAFTKARHERLLSLIERTRLEAMDVRNMTLTRLELVHEYFKYVHPPWDDTYLPTM